MATLAHDVRSCRATVGTRVPVAWISPARAADRRRIDEWCDQVGPVVLDVDRAGHPQQAAAVAIVTWNTHIGAGRLEELVSQLRRGAFTDGTQLPFVVLLQEARRTGLREAAAELDVGLVYAPATRNDSGDDRGTAIVTDLPLSDLLLIELPFERQRRVAIVATATGRTALGSWQLRVATVHLETRTSLRRGSPAAARARQADAFIEAIGSPPMPVVVGGDLNTSWGEDEPAAKAMREAFPDALPADQRMTFAGPLGLRAPLDYLLARGTPAPLEVRMIRERFGSDHHPLLSVVRWNVRGVEEPPLDR
jgi:endonuclease/exonuclease/phosphatase family metal-dependent hydrolase